MPFDSFAPSSGVIPERWPRRERRGSEARPVVTDRHCRPLDPRHVGGCFPDGEGRCARWDAHQLSTVYSSE